MKNIDFDEILETMGKFNDELIRAGVLVAAEGLDDAAKGVVVDYSSETPVVTDGPVRGDQGTVRRLLHPRRGLEGGGRRVGQAVAAGGPRFKTEIRRVATIDEFPQDNEWIQKERAWREATGQL